MLKLLRTDPTNKDFIRLVKFLDAELEERDGTENSFYAMFNKTASLKHAIVVYENDKPVGCGAIKEYTQDTMEIKRMYTLPESRGKGIATSVMSELEKWAMELDCEKCILETGKRQPEAIKLYKKNGYISIPNYGQYVNKENSVCFEKKLHY